MSFLTLKELKSTALIYMNMDPDDTNSSFSDILNHMRCLHPAIFNVYIMRYRCLIKDYYIH